MCGFDFLVSELPYISTHHCNFYVAVNNRVGSGWGLKPDNKASINSNVLRHNANLIVFTSTDIKYILFVLYCKFVTIIVTN